MKEHQLQLSTGSMHCWVGGNGPPLLLLHGFGGTAIWQWHPQVPEFMKSHRVFVPDLMFFGLSSSEHQDRSLEFHGASLIEMMDHFEIEDFHLLGLSYGGFVSLKLAGIYPERVRKLVLVDCPGQAMEQVDHQRILDEFGVADVQDIFIPKSSKDIKRLIHLAWQKPPFVPRFVLRDVLNTLYKNQVQEKRELLDHLLTYLDDDQQNFPDISQETLLIWGEHDRVFPLSLGLKLRDMIGKNASMTVMEGCAHAPNQEKKRVFNRHVLNFLSV